MQKKLIVPLVFIPWGAHILVDDGKNFPIISREDLHIERQNEDQVNSLTTFSSGSLRITDSTSNFDVKIKLIKIDSKNHIFN
jgi:hypothetical protein